MTGDVSAEAGLQAGLAAEGCPGSSLVPLAAVWAAVHALEPSSPGPFQSTMCSCGAGPTWGKACTIAALSARRASEACKQAVDAYQLSCPRRQDPVLQHCRPVATILFDQTAQQQQDATVQAVMSLTGRPTWTPAAWRILSWPQARFQDRFRTARAPSTTAFHFQSSGPRPVLHNLPVLSQHMSACKPGLVSRSRPQPAGSGLLLGLCTACEPLLACRFTRLTAWA